MWVSEAYDRLDALEKRNSDRIPYGPNGTNLARRAVEFAGGFHFSIDSIDETSTGVLHILFSLDENNSVGIAFEDESGGCLTFRSVVDGKFKYLSANFSGVESLLTLLNVWRFVGRNSVSVFAQAS